LVVADLPPQPAQFNLSFSGYKPVLITLDIAADQTNSCSTNLVSVNYLSAMREARMYLAASNYESAVRASGAALNAKPGDPDALALQSEANEHLNAERQQLDRLTRPKRVFEGLCAQYQDASLFAEQGLKTDNPAGALAKAIVKALTNAPSAFQILQVASPEPDTYEVVARQSFSLGILGGTERDCLLVVGQAKDDETQIWFKVLEYEVQHTEIINGLKFQDRKQLIPVHSSRMPMTDALQTRIQEGVKFVTERIQRAVRQ
jgi:hypothetical protein